MPGQASQRVSSSERPASKSAVSPPKPTVAFQTGLQDADAGSVSTGGQLSLSKKDSLWLRLHEIKKVFQMIQVIVLDNYRDGSKRILANASGSSPYPRVWSLEGRSSAAMSTTASLRSSLSNQTCSCARAGGRSRARSRSARSCSYTQNNVRIFCSSVNIITVVKCDWIYI